MHPLNPEAGQYGHMPSDPRAVAVLQRYGPLSLRAFPYLWWRYGDRGLRFTLSDSAYLIAMAEYGDRTLHRHASWTAALLAPRGMPRWLIERNLELLGRMLRRAMPEQPELGGRLLHEAALMRGTRLANMPAAGFERCADTFSQRLGASSRAGLWRGFGTMLAAAVADERDGLDNVVASIEEWACDSRRFGARWIETVRATLLLAESIAVG